MAGLPLGSMTVVVAGGDQPNRRVLDMLPPPLVRRCIAADHGADHAVALGLALDVIVGDLDSVSSETLERAKATGARIERHRPDKDQTDLELALALAVDSSVEGEQVVVIGIGGGRLDHHLANLLLLAAPAYSAAQITAYDGLARVTVVRSTRTLTGRIGEMVSLLAIGGQARSVTTDGLQFQLGGEDLAAGASLGVSNVFVAPEASVSVGAGVVLAIQPDALAEELPGR